MLAALKIVAFSNVRRFAAYSYHETASGGLRFRDLGAEDGRAFTRTARKAEKALSDPVKAAPLLGELGLSTRESAALLGVSHEQARRTR